MPTAVAHLLMALALATLVAAAFNTAMRVADQLRAEEMAKRAHAAALSIYDVPMIGACGKDRCVFRGAGR